MSLTVFLALCILGLDFMIYVLFKLLYGDRRSVIARRVAEQRKIAQAEAAGLFLVPAKKTAPARKEPDRSASVCVSSTDSRKLFARNTYTTRIA
jgi:hypothetical protein